MTEAFQSALHDAAELLAKLRQERTGPEDAQAAVQALKARHPDLWLNLVWEQERFQESIHYDLLVGDEAGTYSLSYCADEGLPWPVRGIQRVDDSLIVRVNTGEVRIEHAMSSLDYAWHTLHVGRHFIHMSLIDQEIRARGIEVSDAELDEMMLRFRRKRRLLTREQVERWMLEHGTTEVQLAGHLRDERAREKLKAQVVAGREEAYFQSHRADFERIQAARLFIPDSAEALRLHARLQGSPEQLLAVARARFLETGETGELFSTLERGELEPDQASLVFAAEPGQLAEPIPSGEGYELVWVMQKLPARFDEATRRKIADRLFDAWLEEKRRTARVEWFWGAAEAAQLPAMSL